MLILAKKAETLEQGREMILENLHNGKGYEKFVKLYPALKDNFKQLGGIIS